MFTDYNHKYYGKEPDILNELHVHTYDCSYNYVTCKHKFVCLFVYYLFIYLFIYLFYFIYLLFTLFSALQE